MLSEHIGEQERQGDLLFVRIQPFDQNVVGKVFAPRTDNVIMEGEKTGHHHVLQEGVVLRAPSQLSPNVAESLGLHQQSHALLHLEKPTTVEHPEHGAVKLEPGYYEVRRQREARGLVVD